MPANSSTDCTQEITHFSRSNLHLAAMHNDASRVARILALNPNNVNISDDSGKTALHEAARMNDSRDSHYEVSEILLVNGADVNARDSEGKTPLHFLVNHAGVGVLGLFLDFGADAKVVDEDTGESLLFPVVQHNRNPEVLRMLIDGGDLDVNHRNEEGRSALHLAGSMHASRKMEVVKCLLRYGADMNVEDHRGSTPLEEILQGMRLGWHPEMTGDLRFVLEHADFRASCRVNLEKEGFCRTVMEHLAKLEMLGVPVHQSYVSRNGYYEECIGELVRAEETRLPGSWVSFFNLLVDGRRRLKNYCGNSELVEEFEKSRCDRKFKIYGSEMMSNVKKGVRRRELYDKSAVLLSECLPVFSPTHLVVRDLLDCVLSNKDLGKFCESG